MYPQAQHNRTLKVPHYDLARLQRHLLGRHYFKALVQTSLADPSFISASEALTRKNIASDKSPELIALQREICVGIKLHFISNHI